MNRAWIAALPLLALAACGESTAPQTVGSTPPPTGGTGGGTGGGVSPTPSPSPAPGTAGTFLDVSSATSFNAVGGFHSINQDTKTGATLYQGNADTVNAPGGSVSYDPRDGIFTLSVADTKAGVSRNYRFQDPAHRNDGQAAEVPVLNGFNYLTLLDDATTNAYATFFYQRPGNTTTTYVALAGYVRTATDSNGVFNAERGAFVFGQQTALGQVPTSGTGKYNGGFVATMVGGSTLQWLNGNSAVDVNFGTGAMSMKLTGTAGAGYNRGQLVNTPTIAVGSSFEANGHASIDLIRSAGFSGRFDTVCFFAACGAAGSTAVDFRSISEGSSVAGASSIDGAFYGPNAANLGGSFRVIGGVPNQRIDILGSFTGARQP